MIRAFLPFAVALSLLSLGCGYEHFPKMAAKVNVTVDDRRYILDTGDNGTKMITIEDEPWHPIYWRNNLVATASITRDEYRKGFYEFSIKMSDKNKPGGYFSGVTVGLNDFRYSGDCPYLIRLEEREARMYGHAMVAGCDLKRQERYLQDETGEWVPAEEQVLHVEYGFIDFENDF